MYFDKETNTGEEAATVVIQLAIGMFILGFILDKVAASFERRFLIIEDQPFVPQPSKDDPTSTGRDYDAPVWRGISLNGLAGLVTWLDRVVNLLVFGFLVMGILILQGVIA